MADGEGRGDEEGTVTLVKEAGEWAWISRSTTRGGGETGRAVEGSSQRSIGRRDANIFVYRVELHLYAFALDRRLRANGRRRVIV